MLNLLDINTVMVNIGDYPLSYLEFSGTVCYLLSVWLIARRNMLTWPIGIVSVLLYMCLFYQIQLYSDTIEQVYYLGASTYGWWHWQGQKDDKSAEIKVFYGSRISLLTWIGVTLVTSILLGITMTRVHLWLPQLFTAVADYPFIDALTTVMSLVAMWLMARRHVESWLYWIVVDLFGIWLYSVKHVYFIAGLYVVLLVLATKGFYDWHCGRSQQENAQ